MERERKHVVNPAGGFENVLLCCWSHKTTEMCRMCRGTSAICMFLLSSLCEPLSLICVSLPSGASVNQKNSQVCFNHFLPYKMFAKPNLPVLTCIFLPFSETFDVFLLALTAMHDHAIRTPPVAMCSITCLHWMLP